MDEDDFDWDEGFRGLGEDWEVIERVLPEGWQQAARESGALRRTRGFDSPATLLRALMIHLVDGCSLRETAVRAASGGLVKVSDVALLGRLRGSGEWFRWMAQQMSQRLSQPGQDSEVLPGRRVRLVDATRVCEPGAAGGCGWWTPPGCASRALPDRPGCCTTCSIWAPWHASKCW